MTASRLYIVHVTDGTQTLRLQFASYIQAFDAYVMAGKRGLKANLPDAPTTIYRSGEEAMKCVDLYFPKREERKAARENP